VYVLRLAAYDGELTAYDEVTITVEPAPPHNQAPFVSAGLDQTITLPTGAVLNGTVSDDGQPSPPGVLTTTWSKISGPGMVYFSYRNSIETRASFSVYGYYLLRLTGDDGELKAYDEVLITVIPAHQVVYFYLPILVSK